LLLNKAKSFQKMTGDDTLESPSALLKKYARTRLQQDDGLVAVLSEDEKCALADELARSGWRTHSLIVQRTVSRMLAESGRRLEERSSALLSKEGSSWIEPSLLESEGGVFFAQSALASVWVPTAADDEVTERPWHGSATREGDGARRKALQAVSALPYFEEEWVIAEEDLTPAGRLKRMASGSSLHAPHRSTGSRQLSKSRGRG
jgi:hypothetical protein